MKPRKGKKMGRPPVPIAVANKVRKMLLRGETYVAISAAVGCGSSVITRVRNEMQAEASEKAIEKLMKGGMSRADATNLLSQL